MQVKDKIKFGSFVQHIFFLRCFGSVFIAIMMDEGENPFAGVEMEGGAYGNDDAFEEDALLEEGTGGKQGDEKPTERPTGLCGCLTVQYYRPYFDVDTEDVKERLIRSLQGYKFHDFLSFTGMKPDLYGPFWLCTTLIFAIGATANFASYLSFHPTAEKPRWNYDFTLLTGAAAVIYGFSVSIPLVLWFSCRYLKIPLSLIQSVCLYGYTHSVYILAALLCMIPSNLVGWLAIILAFGVSGAFLGNNLLAHVSVHNKKAELNKSLVGVVVLGHAIFAIVLKLYFFKHLVIAEDVKA